MSSLSHWSSCRSETMPTSSTTKLKVETQSVHQKIPHSLKRPATMPNQAQASDKKRAHKKPSNSSLFLDRYAMRTENSYVPPYAKSTPTSGAHDLQDSAYDSPTVSSMDSQHHSIWSHNSSARLPGYHQENYSFHDALSKHSPQSTKGGDNSARSHCSRRSASKIFPHHKAAKNRAKLNEKVYWDGCSDSFQSFRYAIEGHLLQVGAGYLLDAHFLYYYKLDPSACQLEETFSHDSEIWKHHKQSCNQIRYDTEYFYGMLMSSCRNITNKTIIKHAKDRDGITAWEELRRDFDNDGSKVLRMEALEELISTGYKTTHHGSFTAYLDKFLSAVHELEILSGETYTESQKKRTLMKNVRGAPGITHLVQKCRDDFDIMPFEGMAQYLRENSKNVEMAACSKSKEEEMVSHSSSQNIKVNPTSVKLASKVNTRAEDTHVSRIGLCEKLGDMSSLDSYKTVDDDRMRQVYMVTHDASLDDSPPQDADALVIRAHLEYTKTSSDRHYAISDSGADSCILGQHCHVISHTGRHACLIGYNPATTASAKVPIISGYIKVMSQAQIPIVLQINEAPYNSNSPVTLLSEYQARDHGTIIDSVSCRHKTISGTFGTQRMMVSPTVCVSFVDRGGLMGFEVLPWEVGDEYRYEIFEITSDKKWTPSWYLQDDPDDCDEFHDAIQDDSLFHFNEDFQDAVQDESLMPNDLLTYWMFNDVLAHNVMHPYTSSNHSIEWIHKTAQHGGDLKPHGSLKEEKLSNLVDFLDSAEPKPIFFNAISSPTEDSLVDKGSVPKTPPVEKGSILDPRDPCSGFTQLNLWCYKQPIVTSVPRRNKEDYNDIWYSCNQFPPAKASIVELPTREKKTEPVQDPVPRVKGIRGTPPKFSKNTKQNNLKKERV